MVNKELITQAAARRLRDALNAKRLSVRWLSLHSGTPYSTLWRQVNGQQPIRIDELSVYAECLGVSPSKIYPGENKSPQVPAVGNEE